MRIVAVATAVLVVAAAAAYVGAQGDHALDRRVTSDRWRRIDVTRKVFEQNPVEGVGIGSQPRASQRLSVGGGPPGLFVSHTTPLTIAAELGAIGLVLYAALLAGAGWALARVRRLNEPFGVALAAVFLALVVHSLAYSGFFEDPMTWLALGLAASVLASARAAARHDAARRVRRARRARRARRRERALARLRPLAVRTRLRARARAARPARPRGRRRVGPRRRSHAGSVRRRCSSRPWPWPAGGGSRGAAACWSRSASP